MGTIDPPPVRNSTHNPTSLWEWQRAGKAMSQEQLSTLEAWAAQRAFTRGDRFRPVGDATWRALSEVPELGGQLSEAEKLVASEKEAAQRRVSPPFQHATVILHFKEKGFAMNRKDLLEGLDGESAGQLDQMGSEGWEMVAAVPFSSGGASMSFTGSANKTDAVLAFFKRRIG
jgi:hypothetical protein